MLGAGDRPGTHVPILHDCVGVVMGGPQECEVILVGGCGGGGGVLLLGSRCGANVVNVTTTNALLGHGRARPGGGGGRALSWSTMASCCFMA